MLKRAVVADVYCSVEAEKSQVQSELDTKLGENKQLQKRVSWLEKQLEVAERWAIARIVLGTIRATDGSDRR